MFQTGDVTTVELASVAVLANAALIMLYLMSNFGRRLIGVISISEDATVIRIGYLNFWGFRRNVIVPVEDIMPLLESDNDLRKQWYVRVRRYSDPAFKLYLPVRYSCP